ncbi:MAG: substrate-binding domain-containing protein, partial [Defluviitaleaceae bacterium]|nr:substrate-binding domain-containing protein [Defluviitaleaceae bacterium]
LLVHDRIAEDRFVAEGYATKRHDVMYNDFIIVGPAGSIASNNNVEQTFMNILNYNLPFVSRGDYSGTHIKELRIWESLGVLPEDNAAYISAGQDMGATLGMAIEMDAFALVDRATWLQYPDVGNLIIICENSEQLLNHYGILVVYTTLLPTESQAFFDWITSPHIQQLISTFGAEEFGHPLFFPNA